MNRNYQFENYFIFTETIEGNTHETGWMLKINTGPLNALIARAILNDIKKILNNYSLVNK